MERMKRSAPFIDQIYSEYKGTSLLTAASRNVRRDSKAQNKDER